jgi:CheY-like chemotaxis protein
LKQVIGQKVSAIAPPIPAATIDIPFHAVSDATGALVPDTYVLEVRVPKPEAPALFLTGAGDAYRKTVGGTRKLSGAELFMALAPPLQAKVQKPKAPSVLDQFPALHRRFRVVEPLVRGQRVLWVDDRPSNNFYERLALAQMGVIVDVAATSAERLTAAAHLHPAVIISDMERNGEQNAGVEFLRSARTVGIRTPVIFYIGEVIEALGVPVGAFAITDRADEMLHFVLDALERADG